MGFGEFAFGVEDGGFLIGHSISIPFYGRVVKYERLKMGDYFDDFLDDRFLIEG
jgi:hypothetical protein